MRSISIFIDGESANLMSERRWMPEPDNSFGRRIHEVRAGAPASEIGDGNSRNEMSGSAHLDTFRIFAA